MSTINQFESAMQRIAAQAAKPDGSLRLAVAYSGGLDSTVLLQLARNFALQNASHLIALHVHHGLSPNADQWAAHCQAQCAALHVPFESACIQLASTAQDGVEATARMQRYAALGAMAARHQIDILLTAHHQDDQAETILLQLLRGSGVAGLCGMQQCHQAPQLLGSDTLLLARPLLDVTRAGLEQFAAQHGIAHIEDESNQDPRYLRNALRLKVMPVLEAYFPGYQSRFSRTAAHAQSTLELIEQLARDDYLHCQVSPASATLDAARLHNLPDTRQDNVLRYWIAAHHKKMPSTARLAEMKKQLMTARDDAQVCVKHGDMEVRRYRQQLSISDCFTVAAASESFAWRGEAEIAFPAFSGTLLIDPVSPGQPGIRREWLLQQQLELRPRQGGERLRLAANRPTRDMKSHYQSHGIPYWMRDRLPFVFAGGELLFAAGIGVHGSRLEIADDCVLLHWTPAVEKNE